MATTYELAQKYYPRLWDKSRLEALVEAGRLTEEEAGEILNEKSANIKSRGNLQKNTEKMEEIKRHNKKAATEAPA